MSVSPILGIDLGTTNSCVAVIDGSGAPRVLADPDGNETTPSVVAFEDEGEGVLVGHEARRQAVGNPRRTIAGSKRILGRRIDSSEVARLAESSPYRIAAAANGDAWIRVGRDRVSPQEIAAHVLTHMRHVAETSLGDIITRAVVTVPAYFDEYQRQATRDAGTIAGVDVVRILNEPTAAALAYGAHRVSPGRRIIAVFDLGGGTFDVSIMAVQSGIFEVLAAGGDTTLGGDDFSQALLRRCADEFFDTHRIDVDDDPVAARRLRDAVEEAKRGLSGKGAVDIELPHLGTGKGGAPIDYRRTITRAEYEELTEPLRQRLVGPCEDAIAASGLVREEIEDVLLVGGMTWTPSIQALVEEVFGRRPSISEHPDQAVALGAAAYAGVLSGALDDTALLDVTPHDIGIQVGDSAFAVVIPKNSMLPVRGRRVFATTRDDQDYVHIEVYEGDAEHIGDNRRLGHITLEGLPQGPAGSVRVELSMTLDIESMLEVTAREHSSGRFAQVDIRPDGGLSHKQLVEIVARQREASKSDMRVPPSRPGERHPPAQVMDEAAQADAGDGIASEP